MPRAHPSPDAATLLEHVTWVRALARSLVEDPGRAEDLAQDTWVSALRHPPRRADNLRAWLATILRNRLRQEARGDARRRRREEAAARPEVLAPTSDVVERASVHRALVERVTELEEPFRTAILLRYFDELSPAEIARRLEVPEPTVRSRLRRGLARLREALDARSGGDRAQWVSALLPIGWPEGYGAPLAAASGTTSVATGTLLGALFMKLNLKLVAAGALVVAGALLLPRVWESRATGAASVNATPELSVPRVAGAQDASPPRADRGEHREAVASDVSTEEATPDGEEPGSARVVPTVEGRVLDLEGRPVHRLALRFSSPAGREERLEGDAAGRFHIATDERGSVVSGDERWATVLAAEVVPGGELSPVLVVAPSTTVAGIVEGLGGEPLANASVAVELRSGSLLELDVVLDASLERTFRTVTDATGRFELAGVPHVTDANIHTRLDGFRPDERPLPAVDAEYLRIVLVGVDEGPDSLRGQVVYRDGTPVPGARVAAGRRIQRTDGEGRFLFDPETSRAAEEVVALQPGFAPARLEASLPAGEEGFRWPAFAVLRLGGASGVIEGIVVDDSGAPISGVRVYPSEPTLIGIDDEGTPAHAEFLLAGARSKGELEREGISPSDRGHTFWHWTTTDEAGRFRIEGLLDRAYVLRALYDPTLAAVDSAPVRPVWDGQGAEVRLVLPAGDSLRRLEGRVTNPAGEPLEGAELWLSRRAFYVEVDELTKVAWDADRPGDVADGTGRFVLEDVPEAGLYLHVEHPGHESQHLAIDATTPAELLVQLVPEVPFCHVQVDLLENPHGADAFCLRNAEDQRVNLELRRGGALTSQPIWPLLEGRSQVLGVAAGEYVLVLLRGEEEVERRPVAVQPGAAGDRSEVILLD